MLLRDPVHGLVSFSSSESTGRRWLETAGRLITQLIDTAEVQRLRRIRALGLASLAFPGGEHSRFAHAIGAAHVMQSYLQRVNAFRHELAPRDRIDGDTAAVAMAAALLHDLGHGPYSHTFEDLPQSTPVHEDWTSAILLDPGSEVHTILRNFDEQAPAVVERLIHGEHEIPHLARAVSGTFDVDRCDYLLRDSHMTGVRYGALDIDWLLASLRLHSAKDGEPAILSVDGEKGLTAVEGFFLARLHMYRQVYFHKAVRAAEVMVQALFRCLGQLETQPGTPGAMASMLRGESVSVAEYLALDDHRFEMALAHYCESKEPTVSALASGLRRRRLFKTLGLKADCDRKAAEARLHTLLQGEGVHPEYSGAIDRVEIDAYTEDYTLGVLDHQGRIVPLLDASPLLRGLSRESFVHLRAVFPPSLRAKVERELRDFT